MSGFLQAIGAFIWLLAMVHSIFGLEGGEIHSVHAYALAILAMGLGTIARAIERKD